MTPRTRPRMASQHADVGVGSADIGATCIRMRSEDALPSARRMPSAVAVLQATSMSSSAAVTTFGRHSTVSPRRIDATAMASHCDCGVASLDTMLISCQAAVLQHRPSQASAGHVIAVRVACGADDTAPRALFIRARPRSSVISPSSRLRGTSSRVLRMRRCGIGDPAEGAAPWKNTKIGKRPPVFPHTSVNFVIQQNVWQKSLDFPNWARDSRNRRDPRLPSTQCGSFGTSLARDIWPATPKAAANHL